MAWIDHCFYWRNAELFQLQVFMEYTLGAHGDCLENQSLYGFFISPQTAPDCVHRQSPTLLGRPVERQKILGTIAAFHTLTHWFRWLSDMKIFRSALIGFSCVGLGWRLPGLLYNFSFLSSWITVRYTAPAHPKLPCGGRDCGLSCWKLHSWQCWGLRKSSCVQRSAESTLGFDWPMLNGDWSKGIYLTHVMLENVAFNPQEEQRRRWAPSAEICSQEP